MSRKALAAAALMALVGHAEWAGAVPFGASADTVPMGVSFGVIHEKFGTPSFKFGTPSFVGPIGPCGDRQRAHYDHQCFTETFSGPYGQTLHVDYAVSRRWWPVWLSSMG